MVVVISPSALSPVDLKRPVPLNCPVGLLHTSFQLISLSLLETLSILHDLWFPVIRSGVK